MDEKRSDVVSEEAENVFEKFILKVLGFLGLTSGLGLMVAGGFWLLYGLFQYLMVSPESIYQQQVMEMYFTQAELGLIIVGLGILIKELKASRG